MTSPDPTQALRERLVDIQRKVDRALYHGFDVSRDLLCDLEEVLPVVLEALASPALGETAGKELKAAYDEGYFAGVADAKYARRYGKVFNQTPGSSRDTEGR